MKTAAAGKAAALSMVGGATRYCAPRIIKIETADELVKAVERGWPRQFGPMGELRTDDGPGFASDRTTRLLEQNE